MRRCLRDSHRRNSLERRPHFFKVIVHSTVHGGQLEIPIEFVRKFGEDLSDSAVLKVPNGNEWVVELKKIEGEVWFHNGWHRFLEYHNISVGYFLVFRYDGDSNFHVLIFNHNACEIKYTLQESNLHDKHLNLESEERAEEDTLAPLSKKRQTTKRTSTQPKVKKQGKRSSASSESQVSKPYCPAQKKRKTKEIGAKQTETNASGEEVSKEFEYQQTDQRIDIPSSLQCLEDEYEWAFLRKERPVTKKERERAHCAAESLKSKNPSFMVAMKPSYLRKGMNVPLVFSRKHFTDGLHHITLRLPNGSTWPARFFLRSNIKALLSGGWIAFARENVLLEGDCCVFEVLKKKNIEMNVSIFRVVEDWVPFVGSVTVNTRHSTTFRESEATQAAREFKSVHPFFTVYIHQSYAQGCSLVMKSGFVKSHLTDKVETITLQDSDGGKWPVKCFIKGGVGRFGSGWGTFVKENDIEEGDVCAFELLEKKCTVLKVSIFKNH
ncbi:B3 domain-containing transcription factor VRN1-like [Macadamia integrifolia]|uniref:B3 domain-containing transcription factor VRN1-like n=1 Tax=Macadamia integrifolia TaxID=60698 RepID=UPI001C4F3445|nr:B3 domain-containing transcription factor VRN1-like [Macadamia integrifolia]